MTIETVVKTLINYLMEDICPCEIFPQMSYLQNTICDEDCVECILKHLEKRENE